MIFKSPIESKLKGPTPTQFKASPFSQVNPESGLEIYRSEAYVPSGDGQQPLALESAEWTVFSESDSLPSLSPKALFLSFTQPILQCNRHLLLPRKNGAPLTCVDSGLEKLSPPSPLPSKFSSHFRYQLKSYCFPPKKCSKY